jgi:SAM-dependent methyltransferase
VTGTGDPEHALYARMRWNTPLSAEHAGLLLDRLGLAPGQRIADLGCGWGELLLTAVARAGAGAAGTGIDQDGPLLARGRAEAASRGLAASVTFADGDAADLREPADRVLCIGAAHAFGGTGEALSALARAVRPGGRLLFGDAFWTRAPSARALGIFGDDLRDLPELLEAGRARGWRVLHFSEADQREWDDFESAFRAGRQEWLLANADDPRAPEIRDWLDRREREYVGVYRGLLGFAYLVLAR